MDKIPFSSNDVVIGAVFGLALFVLVAIRTQRYAEFKTILLAFAIKMVFCFAYGAVYVFYYTDGDSLRYHRNGLGYADMLRADLVNGTSDYFTTNPFFWFVGNATARMENLSGLLHFLLADSFLACSLFFAFISFIGQYLIYRTFTERYPAPHLRLWWKIGVLFFPSLIFWSAGMLKDAVGVWALGCALWGAHNVIQNYNFKSVCLTIIGIYSLFLFRYQVVPALLICLIPLFLAKPEATQIKRGKAPLPLFLRRGLCVALVIAGVVGVSFVGKMKEDYSIDQLPKNLQRRSEGAVRSNNYKDTSVVATDSSWVSLVKAWPVAVTYTLFRPFLWEANSAVVLAQAMENVIFSLLCLRALFLVFTNPAIARKAGRSPTFIACLLFVALYALVVGVAAPNLGTMTRYRISLLPFMSGVLIILEYHRLELVSEVKRRTIELKRSRAALNAQGLQVKSG